tara:strand:- start:22 stop:234 length:213 start_codon:yes stop_codon:yes gene_type:complete
MQNYKEITSARYVESSIEAVGKKEIQGIRVNYADDERIWFIPLDPANRHYAEIMEQVEAGTLTIAPADEE